MDLQYLRRLIKIFDESTASDLSIEEEGTKISLSRKFAESHNNAVYTHVAATPHVNYPVHHTDNLPVPKISPADETPTGQGIEELLHRINSPMVGTFYRSPSPDTEPFVEVGSHISAGATLCIVEAMKLMNEIESDISGTIVKILVENAQAVEYNQPMFLVKPD